MVLTTISGFPRFGENRRLKWALEGYWAGKRTLEELQATAAEIRSAGWAMQRGAGIDLVPVNDHSLYDAVLDTTAMVGAVPERFGSDMGAVHERRGPVPGDVSAETYFAMARGLVGTDAVTAMDMTKWFDTNYHYLVPELTVETGFRLASAKPFGELAEATSQGVPAKPVLVGPLTYLALASATDGSDPMALLDRLLPVYREVVRRLAAGGAAWIQLDEPILVTDRGGELVPALERAYAALAEVKGSAKLLVNAPFGHVGAAYPALAGLPVDGLGLDLTRGGETADLIRAHGFPAEMWLAAGVVDGRNVWRNDLDASLSLLEGLTEHVPAERLMVSSSCSLLHVPLDVAGEDGIDPRVRGWLSFARQKLDEVVTLARGLSEGREAIAAELVASRAVREEMAGAAIRTVAAVRDRVARLDGTADRRSAPFAERAERQRRALRLPELPTTTIGSFPQTAELRAERKRLERGEIDDPAYDETIETYIRAVVAEQEAIGIDVLVHGEPERNDMVQYFGEQLDGFVFTTNGWVQSYGSRMVRPPIIAGDVWRAAPMTLRWTTFAQGLTDRPMKGMLTGPVTILNWSFVRDDQPRADTCRQIALAIRDEVADLEAAGIRIIQIDEPALREGLPLRRADQDAYLAWATESFRIAAGVAASETQIHTHMCYSEFGSVIEAISALDADVLSIENARSDLEMLGVFQRFGYDKGIGPGVFDIHSPRVPPVDELAENLMATLSVLDRGQIWVNPDCGLKTRKPEEAHAALVNMVAAARRVRETSGVSPAATPAELAATP